jgi:imidazole glycerol phosphate synthase glutamine amidotransferase subunit
MTRLVVGIIDYGIGNYASLHHTLYDIGQRCRITDDPAALKQCDVLLLPGVGAFRPAMEALKTKDLDGFLIEEAQKQRPILGICLGMQLLCDASHENGYTKGLGLIPGEVVPLGKPRWHIGWNAIEVSKQDALFQPSNGDAFYFNHSYTYQGSPEFQVCKASSGRAIPAAVCRGKVVGVQFHPEKSQVAGHDLLKRLIEGLCHA